MIEKPDFEDKKSKKQICRYKIIKKKFIIIRLKIIK